MAYLWVDTEQDYFIIPTETSYSVDSEYPYRYQFRSRAGEKFPTAVSKRSSGVVIAYFVASPEYPWWYVYDFMGLKSSEVLAMDERFTVFPHPMEWLDEQDLSF